MKPRSPFRPDLFRAAALARQNEPAATQGPALLPSLYWAALAALAFVMAAAAAWLYWGRVERLADGRGLVIRDSEFGIYEVASPVGGQLAEVLVKEGDTVQAGQTIARFHRAEMRAEIEAAETLLADWKKNPTDQGKIPALELRIQELRIHYEKERKIRTERAGRVLEVVVSSGNVIAPGKTILRLESLTGPLEVLAYVSAPEGKKIRPGMEVRIVPTTAPALSHGHLRGKVNYVSAYPVTGEYLTSELGGNERLANYLLSDGSSIEVEIELPQDAGKYQWTAGPSEGAVLESGLLVEAFVVLETVQPLTLFLGK